MKTRANLRATLFAAIVTTFGLGLTTNAVHADLESVTVLATQTYLVELNSDDDETDESDALATEFTEEIRNDLDQRLPLEMDELIAVAN